MRLLSGKDVESSWTVMERSTGKRHSPMYRAGCIVFLCEGLHFVFILVVFRMAVKGSDEVVFYWQVDSEPL